MGLTARKLRPCEKFHKAFVKNFTSPDGEILNDRQVSGKPMILGFDSVTPSAI
tara:strand:+ start:1125 stop:1283 length:159 start_codon:yes stop_codon:yes gene_type:complete